MNAAQIIYALALALIFAARGPIFPAWVLLANMLATLAACLAMDLGALERDGATLTMMIIDLASGAALMQRPGLSRVVAVGYAATVPLYSLTIVFEVQTDTTFAIVNGIAFIQLAVAGFGSGGNGGGNRRRFCGLPDYLASSFRIDPVGERGMAQDRRHLSANSGGVKGGR